MAKSENLGREPQPESELLPEYCQVARYQDEQGAGRVYIQAQDVLFKQPCELSAYRLQLEKVWHVAVLGETPTEEIDRTIRTILATGEPTSLPQDVLTFLNQRRLQAKQISPWIEGHYRPGKRPRF